MADMTLHERSELNEEMLAWSAEEIIAAQDLHAANCGIAALVGFVFGILIMIALVPGAAQSITDALS